MSSKDCAIRRERLPLLPAVTVWPAKERHSSWPEFCERFSWVGRWMSRSYLSGEGGHPSRQMTQADLGGVSCSRCLDPMGQERGRLCPLTNAGLGRLHRVAERCQDSGVRDRRCCGWCCAVRFRKRSSCHCGPETHSCSEKRQSTRTHCRPCHRFRTGCVRWDSFRQHPAPSKEDRSCRLHRSWHRPH